MSIATLSSIVLIALCSAFLVQSVRMMRSFEQVKKGGLKETVEALDRATAQARGVLADLRDTLQSEGAANARAVARGEEMREELTVMVGIANAVAERIVASVEAAPKVEANPKLEAVPAPEAETVGKAKAKAKAPRTRTRPATRAKPARTKVPAPAAAAS